MRFPEAAHMPDGSGEAAPVWARRAAGGGGGNPLVALIFAILAMVGALCIGLAIYDKSFAAGGARIDGWIKPLTAQIGKMTGQAGDQAEDAAADAEAAAGDAAEAAGDAAKEAGEAAEKAGDAAKEAATK